MRDLVKKLWNGKGPWRVVRLALAIPVIGLVLLMVFENKLIFFPSEFPVGDWGTESIRMSATTELRIEEVDFHAKDGTKLNGWFFTPHNSGVALKTERVILFSHGNAGNLSHRKHKCAVLASIPATVFIYDYRGYGNSDGSPDEEGVCQDVDAAWELLLSRGWKPEQIIVYGTSLGGAVAVDLASRVECAALVTESTFTSIPDMATVAYPFVPKFIIRTKFDSLSKIKSITCPKLIMHGQLDRVIPFEMSGRLRDAAPDPKIYLALPQAGHDDVYTFTDLYLKSWRDLVRLTGTDPQQLQ